MSELGIFTPVLEASVAHLHKDLRGELPARSYVEQFRYKNGVYILESDDAHGGAHTAKVMGFAALIGMFYIAQEREKYPSKSPQDILNLPSVLYAAAYHDSRRDYSKDDEKEHGIKAALWLIQNKEIHQIPKECLDEVIYLVQSHVPEDRFLEKVTPELEVLKDADSFDRFRFPKGRVYSFDGSYIHNTPLLEYFIPIAEAVNSRCEMLQRTTNLDPFSCGMQSFCDTQVALAA